VTAERLRLGLLLLAIVIAAAIATSAGALKSADATRLVVAAVLGVVAVRLVRPLREAVAESEPSGLEKAARPAPPPAPFRPAKLRELELLVASSRSSRHFERRVQPVLREIARRKLRVDHHVELDRDAARARALLGDALYDVVRADYGTGDGGPARGLTVVELGALVDVLERL
jgi:hypothetical protein